MEWSWSWRYGIYVELSFAYKKQPTTTIQPTTFVRIEDERTKLNMKITPI